MKKAPIIAALAVLAAAPTATAQQSLAQYQQRKTDLVALSGLFGELHQIRRLCEPRLEGDAWRERMKKLIELEEPQPQLRDDMVASFNKGYRAAGQHFQSCSRRARDHAAARAVQGETIIARLTAPLYDTLEQQKQEDAQTPSLSLRDPGLLRPNPELDHRGD